MKKKVFDPLLYLVTNSTGLPPARFLEIVDSACKNGVTAVQLREKERSGREFWKLARQVKEVTDRNGVPLIIDDRADVAAAVDAAGVHLGQNDLPVSCARLLLGPDKLVGASAKTVEQAREAYRQGADYLGVGALFPTATKVVTRRTSVDALREICGAVPIPVAAIGGLTAENCSVLAGVPVAGLCVVSAIMKAGDPGPAAAELRAAAEQLVKGREVETN